MRAWGTAALAAFCLFAFSTNSYADRHKHSRSKHSHSRVTRGYHHHHYQSRHSNRYYAYPRSSFVITFGNGYAGRGYYYGPPRMPYYYRAPGVVYYSSRARLPLRYR